MNYWWHFMMSLGIIYSLLTSITAYENNTYKVNGISQSFFYLALLLALLNIWSPF